MNLAATTSPSRGYGPRLVGAEVDEGLAQRRLHADFQQGVVDGIFIDAG